MFANTMHTCIFSVTDLMLSYLNLNFQDDVQLIGYVYAAMCVQACVHAYLHYVRLDC